MMGKPQRNFLGQNTRLPNMTPIKLLLTLLLTALAIPALAQPVGPPPTRFESMELRVLGADLVVTGEVAGWEQISIPEDPNKHFRVAFRISETIKGQAPEDFHFVLRSGFDYDEAREPVLKAWLAKKMRLLLFLSDSRAAALRPVAPLYSPANRQWLHLREPYALVSIKFSESVIELDPDNTTVRGITSDFKPLIKPAEILDAARAASRTETDETRILQTDISLWKGRLKGAAIDSHIERNGLSILVPLDKRTERLSRTRLESPDPSLRELGIECLAYFLSQRNAVLLRELTTDKDRGVSSAAQITLHCWGLRKEDILPPKKLGD